MADKAYSAAVSSTTVAGFDGTIGTILPERSFLDSEAYITGPGSAVALVETLDEEITIPSTMKVFLLFVPGDALLSDIEVWDGQNQTGNQFTIIPPNQAFTAGGGEYEARYYRRTGMLMFDSEVMNENDVVYARYNGEHTNIHATLLATIWGELRAAQQQIVTLGTAAIIDGSAVASEAIDEEWCYIQDDGTLAVLANGDLSNIDRIDRAVYVHGTYSLGQSATFRISGPIDKPSWKTGTWPPGRILWVGRNGKMTWDGDPTNGLSAGDYIRPVGRSFDLEGIVMDLRMPTWGVK